MTRTRTIITWLVFLATFLWLLVPDLQSSPAVLWPSIVAVGLAFVTRDIYLSLFLGALSGAVLLQKGNVAFAFLDLFARNLIPALKDPWNISVLVFTIMMGGFTEVLNRTGGMSALAEWFLGRAHTRRRAGMGAYLMGWVIFFDGLASSMLVGKTMRAISDRAGLSREKLSFIADSTSAPIAGLALVSTWVAYEMSVIRQGFENLGATVAPFQLLVQSLPYRFYNYFVLWIVFLTIWLQRDLGPMRAAERRTQPTDSTIQRFNDSTVHLLKKSLLALFPLAVLVIGVFVGLYIHGGGLNQPLSLATAIDALGKADAAIVFVWITALASIVAIGVSVLFARNIETSAVNSFFQGMNQMFLPTLILVFAWVLNAVIKELGAAQYLVSFLGNKLPPQLLPALVFSLASLISFSTGTSWGTMAIVMPLVIPLAAALTGFSQTGNVDQTMIATVGAVLAGAVFGDHCSPISDTTIVSAVSSDCDTMDHVRTQLPYAGLAAIIALFFGYGPAGFNVSPVWLLLAGILICWAILRYLAKPSSLPVRQPVLVASAAKDL